MTRSLIGTVAVVNGQTVCLRPDGSTYGIGGAPADFPCFGGLRPYDAGKQIWRVGGVFQMENDEQRARRLGR